MLEYDCKDSEQALPEMSKSLALFDDDYVSKAMIQQFIIDEQEHYNWVRQHLNLIEEIGYDCNIYRNSNINRSNNDIKQRKC